MGWDTLLRRVREELRRRDARIRQERIDRDPDQQGDKVPEEYADINEAMDADYARRCAREAKVQDRHVGTELTPPPEEQIAPEVETGEEA